MSKRASDVVLEKIVFYAGCLIILLCAVGFLAGLAGCGSASSSSGGGTVTPTASPIKHVVIIMQENRTFDNLFNGFPGADTVQSGLSGTATIPLTQISLADARDPSHSHTSWWKAWDNGKLDGFAQSSLSPTTFPYSYVNPSEVATYWNMAKTYTLGDRMFQANTGPSFIAHQYMIAGQSGNVAENPNHTPWGCDAPSGTTAKLIGPNGTELPGVYPCFDYTTMADLLDAKGVSWRFYTPSGGDAFDAIRKVRFGTAWTTNIISPQTKVLTDIAGGSLAQVTWVIPDSSHSDHPGNKSLTGPDWVASVVNAIGKSQFWDSTAIFLAWDDWGGWYDHVVPPVIDEMGYGFRVPVIVISPYAKRGYISHIQHEESGFLAYIEKNFSLGNMGARDAAADNFADCFDYTQTPTSYAAFSTKVTVEQLLSEKPSGPPDTD